MANNIYYINQGNQIPTQNEGPCFQEPLRKISPPYDRKQQGDIDDERSIDKRSDPDNSNEDFADELEDEDEDDDDEDLFTREF